jgi:uncharacterized protein YpmS
MKIPSKKKNPTKAESQLDHNMDKYTQEYMNSNKAYQNYIDHIFINQFMARFSFLGGEIPIFWFW